MADRASLVYDFCSQVPPKTVALLARSLSNDMGNTDLNVLRKNLGLTADVFSQLAKLKELYDSPRELACALEAGAKCVSTVSERDVTFVWTGPTQYLIARQTEQVLLELINTANRELYLVSFAAYKVESLVAAVENAISRGVKVNFILETDTDSAGRLNFSAMKAFDSITGAHFYHWPKHKRSSGNGEKHGVMHIKCALSEKALLVTSANLTDRAINDNMELGVLLKDANKSAVLLKQFAELIRHEILEELSGG